jgi:uncharacterized protein
MARFGYILGALAAFVASPAAAKGMIDCPSRDAPFSTASPLIDLLLNPAAKAIVDDAIPGLSSKMPPGFLGTNPPSFASILTVKDTVGFLRVLGIDLPAVNQKLGAIPVTTADKIARCARYDGGPLRLSVPASKTRVLLFEKINGFRDSPSVDAAHAAFTAMAARKGWAIVTTDKGSAFTHATLKQFDVVIWNNISGDVLTLNQRYAFKRYMERGGGFLGVHGSAGDPVYFWDWYVDDLIGARFAGHPMAPQFQTARVDLQDGAHPAVAGLPVTWEMNDEWYSFKNNPRTTGSRIIATLDEKTYNPEAGRGPELRMGSDHPIVWSRCIGPQKSAGRVFYSAIGHRPERYSDALYVKMLEQAVEWTSGQDGKACAPAK